MKAWALEGLPFSGKTSTSEFVRSLSPASIVVPDYHDLLHFEDAPRFSRSPGSPSDQLQRVEAYVAMDDVRWQVANAAGRSTTIFDRCHISLVAYSLALETVIGKRTVDGCISIINRALADDEHALKWPDVIIYLEMKAATAAQRCHQHATSMDERFRTEAFSRQLVTAYETALNDAQTEVLRVSSEQDREAMCYEVATAVLGK